MSIRLKDVEWKRNKTGEDAIIAGAVYRIFSDGDTGGFFNIPTRTRSKDITEVRAACEQHALGRIREAVEVVDDHIPDATKMISNSPELPDGWQPIETPPGDGTRILICIAGKPISVERAYFHDGKFWYDRTKDWAYPTHWMPLPKPPKEGTNG